MIRKVEDSPKFKAAETIAVDNARFCHENPRRRQLSLLRLHIISAARRPIITLSGLHRRNGRDPNYRNPTRSTYTFFLGGFWSHMYVSNFFCAEITVPHLKAYIVIMKVLFVARYLLETAFFSLLPTSSLHNTVKCQFLFSNFLWAHELETRISIKVY